MTDPKKRIRVFAPLDWQEAFEAAAAKEGKSVSEWLRDAGYEKLPGKVRSKLSDVRTVGRPKKQEDPQD